MKTPEEIVKELSKKNPFVYQCEVEGGTVIDFDKVCYFCGCLQFQENNHKPDCLYLEMKTRVKEERRKGRN